MEKGEELPFNFDDEEDTNNSNNTFDNIDYDLVNIEKEEFDFILIKHRIIGINDESLEELKNLLKAKSEDNIELFPSHLFVNITDIIKNEKDEIKKKIKEFYKFVNKYKDNINHKDLNEVINLKNNTKYDIIDFWKKKLNFKIFNNLNKGNIIVNDFHKAIVQRLIEKGYEIKNIFSFFLDIKKYDEGENKLIISSIIDSLTTFKIQDEFYKEIKNIINNFSRDSAKEIYIYASNKKNNHEQEKLKDLNLDELIFEIEKSNSKYFSEDVKKNIINQIRIIEETYVQYNGFRERNQITEWVKEEFPNWKKYYANNETKQEYMAKILAIISIANKIFTSSRDNNGYKLRTIQLIDVLLFINKEKDRGLIEQISTGEGKSSVICALSTFLALIGYKVDIITSALNLAKRDVKELKDFYKLFNLTVDYVEHFNPKPYEANIVYGTFLEFEGDYLEDLTSDKIVRGKRPFEVLIVDEVDNLFIDNIEGSTRLVYSTMGYQFLTPIYMQIFFTIEIYEKQFSNAMNNIVDNMDYPEEDKKLIKEHINEPNFKKETVYPYLKQFICEFLRELYKDNIKENNNKEINKGNNNNENNNNQINNNNNKNENKLSLKEQLDNIHFYLPTNLRPYFESQLEKWVDSAYEAIFYYQEKQDYVISNGRIAPVDKDNTGEIEQRTVYRNGLHRMLEIKHGLRLHNESLNHTFLSHITFFNKYYDKKNKILNFYGMTGTLGDDNTKKIFQNEFYSNILIMPTYKAKRFVELPSILCQNEKDQLNQICKEIEYHAKNNRKILVINSTIKEAIKLRNNLKHRNANLKIGLYTRDDNKEEIENLDNQDNQIILSTNLAGRGTDIKTSKTFEENGGLHIILTYMPNNLRIERQAFGRTSRQGNKGSAQMILLKKDNTTITDYKKKRDLIEKNRLDEIKERIEKTLFKDKLFSQYIELVKTYKIHPNSYLMNDIDERWGIFLDENISDEILDKIKVKQRFDLFMESLKKILAEKYNSENKYNNYFLRISDGYKKYRLFDERQFFFNLISKKKEKFSFAASYYDAILNITFYEGDKININIIKENLLKTKEIVEKIIKENVDPCWDLLLERKSKYEGCPIYNQFLNRKALMNNLLKNIENNIQVVIRYEKIPKKKNIELLYEKKNIKDIYFYKEAKDENLKEIDESLDYLYDAGLFEVYQLYLKKHYKWYEKILLYLKLPFEFILACVAFCIPIVGLYAGYLVMADYFVSCFKFAEIIDSGKYIPLKDYLFNAKIYYKVGRNLRNTFSFLKEKILNKLTIQKIVHTVNVKNISTKKKVNFIEKSGNLRQIKNQSTNKIIEDFKLEFENNFIKEEEICLQYVKYFLCFDDYFSNSIWKDKIKNLLIKQYKIIFKNEFLKYENQIIQILTKGYENNNSEEGIKSIKELISPIFTKCLYSFINSLKELKQKRNYDEEDGLNSLEHLIRNINSNEIDDKISKEIAVKLIKNGIINKDGEFSSKLFNEKCSLRFLLENNYKEIYVEELNNIDDLSLRGISKYPIVNKAARDRILHINKNFNVQNENECDIIKLNYLNEETRNTLRKIIKEFSDDKRFYNFLEELKDLIIEKIVHLFNKKIYSRLDSNILGNITESSLKDTEKEVIAEFKKLFFKKPQNEN